MAFLTNICHISIALSSLTLNFSFNPSWRGNFSLKLLKLWQLDQFGKHGKISIYHFSIKQSFKSIFTSSLPNHNIFREEFVYESIVWELINGGNSSHLFGSYKLRLRASLFRFAQVRMHRSSRKHVCAVRWFPRPLNLVHYSINLPNLPNTTESKRNMNLK